MIEKIAFVLGLVSIVIVFLGYLQRSKAGIILFGIVARLFAIAQYSLLGAIEGAVFNACTVVCLVLAQNRDTAFIKKHCLWVFLASNLLCIAGGLISFSSIYSLLPLAGVLLHSNAAWLKTGKQVRAMTLIGFPFWLSYNLLMGVYASAIGDVLCFMALICSVIRYDVLKKEPRKKSV